MSDITQEVIFKKDSGESLSLSEKFVRLHSRANGVLTVNFRTPEKEMVDLKEFFQLFQNDELLKIDIGGTGDIGCSFKGMSPIMKSNDDAGFTFFSLSITLQDLEKMKAYNEPPECGCG
ncbi:hypothetical protein [Methanobacterium alcaliphilum]|uniref:hypothetical protein n=1 Tax=Methanobacterium alcaliphilum TaxID=392018 RepID=UPI00200AF1EF|nr:hypothetical protein [Methanobacterium alcaliphilum]MCK9152259.1 hypothetical protein [Methanobacterium alcaliphilum]